jgi:tetratricopeptide (TPR) repeat protein
VKRTSAPAQAAAFNQGLWLHQQGHLADAERIYRQVLQREPANASALHMFGVVALQTGRSERAVKMIGKAIALDPNNADAFNNLGLALQDQRRSTEAVAAYDRAVAINPDDADVYSNRGLALEALRRFTDALASYDKAIALRSNFPEAHNNRGNVLRSLNRPDEALSAYAGAMALRPDFAAAHYNNGNVLRDLRRGAEALASYDKAIALRPDYADAYCNRGVVLQELRRSEEAIASCDRAIASRPDLGVAHHSRGNALRALGRYDEALASLDLAIALMPGHASLHNDRGVVLHGLRRFEEALASYGKATLLQPDYAEVWVTWAISLLQIGRFAEGWRLYEWRKKLPEAGAVYRSFRQPLWSGEEDISGKTLFIHCEQGLGDTLQFCRYARLAEARGAKVVMAVQQPLVRLLEQLGPTIQVTGPEQVPADFDYYCPLLSLPLAFGTEPDTVPAALPYLQASAGLREQWSARLPVKTRRRIGVAWRGSATFANDSSRSIDLTTFRALLDLDAEWVCIQKDISPDDQAVLRQDGRIASFGEERGDFADTAALLDTMDLVITVDTSVGHLAAAMGKPVWLLVSCVSDWRWMLDRDDSPWYPSVRLFRQRKVGSWSDVFDQVKRELVRTL